MLKRNQQILSPSQVSQRSKTQNKSKSSEGIVEEQKRRKFQTKQKQQVKTLYEVQYSFLLKQQRINEDSAKKSKSKDNTQNHSSINQSDLVEWQDSSQFQENYQPLSQSQNAQQRFQNVNDEFNNLSYQNTSSQQEFEVQVAKKVINQNKTPLKIRQSSFSNLQYVNQPKSTIEQKNRQNYFKCQLQQKQQHSQRAASTNLNQKGNIIIYNSDTQKSNQGIEKSNLNEDLSKKDKITQNLSQNKKQQHTTSNKPRASLPKNAQNIGSNLTNIIKNKLVSAKKRLNQHSQRLSLQRESIEQNKQKIKENKNKSSQNSNRIFVVEDLPNYKENHMKKLNQQKKLILKNDQVKDQYFSKSKQETPQNANKIQNLKMKRHTSEEHCKDLIQDLGNNQIKQLDDIS